MSGKVSETPSSLLDGVVVADLTSEPGTMATRMLGDLGAEVVRVVPSTGDPLDALPDRRAAWTYRSSALCVTGIDDPALDALLARADIVNDTPQFLDAWAIDPGRAPNSVWVSLTPFGLDGPRAHPPGT